MTAVRSWLYVPGHRPDLVDKALRGAADAVVIDLEDAVPAEHKAAARDTVLKVADPPPAKPVWVRLNDLAGPHGEADLAGLAGVPVTGVRLAKCEDPAEVRRAGEWLGRPMQLLVESAVGLERVARLARAHPLVSGIGLGEADLAADLGTVADAALSWCRSRIVVAARAAGLPAPVQSVWVDVGDLDGLRRSTVRGRYAGFFGRSVVHPRQVLVVNEVFTPSVEEVAAARALVDEVASAGENGQAAFLDRAGRMVDPSVVKRAVWTLELASELDSQKENP
jgi:citrate lyase subunit beta / citryl-CoA lyase